MIWFCSVMNLQTRQRRSGLLDWYVTDIQYSHPSSLGEVTPSASESLSIRQLVRAKVGNTSFVQVPRRRWTDGLGSTTAGTTIARRSQARAHGCTAEGSKGIDDSPQFLPSQRVRKTLGVTGQRLSHRLRSNMVGSSAHKQRSGHWRRCFCVLWRLPTRWRRTYFSRCTTRIELHTSPMGF